MNALGHYANKCRTNTTRLPNFRNQNGVNNTSPNVEIKREFASIFFKYFKKPNHDISECRMRIFNEKKREKRRNQVLLDNNRSINEINHDNNHKKLTYQMPVR